MATYLVHTGARHTTGANVRDGRQPIEIIGERLAELTAHDASRKETVCETGSTRTLYRLASGDAAIHVWAWARLEDRLTEGGRIFFPSRRDLERGGRYEALGATIAGQLDRLHFTTEV